MTTSRSRPKVTMMIVAHRAMVTDLRRIGTAARALAEGRTGPDGTELRAYARKVLELVVHHHEGEDHHLWPALAAQGAPREALDLMAQEHAALEVAVGRLRTALDVADPDRAAYGETAVAADEVAGELERHTADEERELTGRLGDVLDERTWSRFQNAMLRSAPLWSLTFMPSWLVAVATPEEVRDLPGVPVGRLLAGGLARRRRRAFGPHHA